MYSIIKKSQLEGAKRLDAEYYQPEYFIDFSKGKWQPIGDFFEMCQYGISRAMNNKGIGYPILKMDDIKDAFLFDDEVRYADIPDNLFRTFKLDKNDVLFNRVNSEEFVGRTGIFKLNIKAVFASYLIKLRLKKDSIILPDYLNIFLNSNFGLKQIRKFRRRAVNQANVNAEELKQIRIAILPSIFQKEIEKLSNESWRNLEVSKALYSQAESLLFEDLDLENFGNQSDSLFTIVNFSEVKEVARLDAEYFNSDVNKLIDKIKKIAKPLGELVSIKKGIEPGAEEYLEQGKQFIRVSSLSKYGIDDNNQKCLSEELYQKLKNDFQPKKGEILLTKDASPGVTYVLKEDIDSIVSGGVLRLKIKNKSVEDEYLALCLNSVVGQMQAERDAGGSVIKHWKPEQIKQVMIPILAKPVQEKITSLIRESFVARKKAKGLLDEAKQKVEEMIENN